MDWLDTKTKALLQRSPPEKLAPPGTATFALILLAVGGGDRSALVRAVQRVAEASAGQAERLLRGRLPVCVRKGLTYVDGQIGQFELICCDAASVIIADDVVANARADYLAGLLDGFRKIDEFELVTVRIDSVPNSPSGQEFCNRFLGGRTPVSTAVVRLMRKKVRIMQHWAARIGGQMTVISGPTERQE
jgi:hypothetical protein